MIKPLDLTLTEIDIYWDNFSTLAKKFCAKIENNRFKKPKTSTRRHGPFKITKLITNILYQIQDDNDPTITKTVHRDHLVKYSPK